MVTIKDIASKTELDTTKSDLTDKINNTKTDLINTGLKFDADNNDVKTNKLGSKVTVAGDANITTKITQTGDDSTIAVTLNKDLNVNTVTATNTVKAGTATMGNQSATDNKGATQTGNFVTGLDNTAWNMANPFFVSGRAATEDQLKSAHDSLKASELHIAPTAVKTGSTEAKGGVANGTENVYKYDAATKKVTLTYNDGNGKAVTDTKAVIDFSDLNIPAASTPYSFKTNATGNLEDGSNAAETAVASGKTVNFGAGKKPRVKEAFRFQLTLCFGYTTLFWLLMMLAPGVVAGIFTSDAVLIEYTTWAMRIYMAGILAMGVQIACQQSFMALGQAKVSLLLACLRKIILLIPLIFILPCFTADKCFGVFLAEPVSDILAATITAITFFSRFDKILDKGAGKV